MREKKPDKRKLQGAETKKKLYEIAEKLFFQYNFSDVSVEDITDEAGITKYIRLTLCFLPWCSHHNRIVCLWQPTDKKEFRLRNSLSLHASFDETRSAKGR